MAAGAVCSRCRAEAALSVANSAWAKFVNSGTECTSRAFVARKRRPALPLLSEILQTAARPVAGQSTTRSCVR
jgi:hypothetical protein